MQALEGEGKAFVGVGVEEAFDCLVQDLTSRRPDQAGMAGKWQLPLRLLRAHPGKETSERGGCLLSEGLVCQTMPVESYLVRLEGERVRLEHVLLSRTRDLARECTQVENLRSEMQDLK